MSFSFIIPVYNQGATINTVSGIVSLGTQDQRALFAGARQDAFTLAQPQVGDIYAEAAWPSAAGAADTLIILNARRLQKQNCTRIKFKANAFGANFPQDIAELVAWWDATRIGEGVDSDNFVSTLPDRSGNGHNLTATTTRRPQYVGGNTDANFGYQHYLQFDGSTDSLLNTSLAAAFSGNDTPHTTLGIWRTTKPTFGAVWGWCSNAATKFHVFGEYNPGRPEVVRRDDAALSKAGEYGAVSTATGNVRVISQVFTGTTANVYVNGTQLGGSPDLNVGVITFNEFRVGSIFYFGATQDHWGGQLGELIVLDSAAGAGLRQSLENYLTAKWITPGLVDILTSGMSFVGPDSVDYIATFALQSPIVYGYVQYSTDGSFNKKSTYPHEKILFGKRFSLGKEPSYSSAYKVLKASRSAIRSRWVVSLRFDGVTEARVQEFEAKVAQLSDGLPFCVYDDDDSVLKGLRLLYCKLANYSISPINALSNSIAIELEEVM